MSGWRNTSWTRQYYAQDPCVYCGATHQRKTVEHVVPVSSGGHLGHENQVIACRTCNRRRGRTPLLVWLVAMHKAKRNSLVAQQLVNRGLHA